MISVVLGVDWEAESLEILGRLMISETKFKIDQKSIAMNM
jgi:hypothetical protein